MLGLDTTLQLAWHVGLAVGVSIAVLLVTPAAPAAWALLSITSTSPRASTPNPASTPTMSAGRRSSKKFLLILPRPLPTFSLLLILLIVNMRLPPDSVTDTG